MKTYTESKPMQVANGVMYSAILSMLLFFALGLASQVLDSEWLFNLSAFYFIGGMIAAMLLLPFGDYAHEYERRHSSAS